MICVLLFEALIISSENPILRLKFQKLSEVEIKEIHEYTDGADKYSRLLLVAIVILIIHKVSQCLFIKILDIA